MAVGSLVLQSTNLGCNSTVVVVVTIMGRILLSIFPNLIRKSTACVSQTLLSTKARRSFFAFATNSAAALFCAARTTALERFLVLARQRIHWQPTA